MYTSLQRSRVRHPNSTRAHRRLNGSMCSAVQVPSNAIVGGIRASWTVMRLLGLFVSVLVFAAGVSVTTESSAADQTSSATRGYVLEFSATWCGPCQQMGPIVSRLERQRYPIRKVDIEKEPALTRRFKVQNIPTFVLIVDGQEVERVVGATTESRLLGMLKRIPKSRDEVAGQRRTPATPVAGVDRTEPDRPVIRASIDDERSLTVADGGSPAMQASVRIRVKDQGGTNYGSGTVIESRPGQTLILTCGHILRGLTDTAVIEVDYFTMSGNETFVGRAVDADLKADVGLIAIQTSESLPAVAIASEPTSTGEQVLSIGCSGGDDPTAENLQVTALNRYKGPQNIECTGQPVQGRSGGGLFNDRDEVVGICIAADPETKRGLYCGLKPIIDLLRRLKLDRLIPDPDDPSRGGEQTEGSEIAAEQPELDTEDAASSIDPETAAQFAEIAAQAGNAEVICIIRPLNQKDAASRIVIINRASTKFVQYLTNEVQRQPVATTARSIKQSDEISPNPLVETGRNIPDGDRDEKKIAINANPQRQTVVSVSETAERGVQAPPAIPTMIRRYQRNPSTRPVR